jgi:hypothetical protein
LIQRMGFGVYFFWYVSMALHLVYRARAGDRPFPEQAHRAAPAASR